MIRRLTVWIAALTVGMLMMAVALAGAARAQEAAGSWHGVLQADGAELKVGLEVKTKPGGGLEAVALGPQQTPDPIPVDRIEVKDGVLTFTVASIQGSYEGRWEPAKSAWVGDWKQAGVSMPLTLQKGPVAP
jgi:hypothetical protein